MTRTKELCIAASCAGLLWVAGAKITLAQQGGAHFDESVIRFGLGVSQDVDLSYLQQDLDAPPGSYTVDVFVNRRYTQRKQFVFVAENARLVPRLTVADLSGFGVNTHAIKTLREIPTDTVLEPLKEFVPDLELQFDAPNNKLTVTIPQLYMTPKTSFTDVADQALWQDGEPALVMSYNFVGSHFRRKGDAERERNTDAYFGWSSHANYGPWRLFSQGAFFSYVRTTEATERKEHSADIWNVYLERDIRALRSRVRFGEVYTEGELFDSVPVRGFSLQTNAEMLSYAERSFVPVISGFARSYAVIRIRQNGRVLYQTTVPPGPWSLTDLPTFGTEGDLQVVTTESDGTETVETIAYASVPVMLRQGQWRYSLEGGKYGTMRQKDSEEPFFLQGTVKYGLPYGMTAYAGFRAASHYRAALGGLGLSLGRFGALSADVTTMDADRTASQPSRHGSAYRVRYAKSFLQTGTSLQLSGNYSPHGEFTSFSDVNRLGDGDTLERLSGRREISRLTGSIVQQFGQWGSLRASGTYTRYGDSDSDYKNYQVTYSKVVSGVGVSLSYERNYQKSSGTWHPTNQVMLHVDVPLSLLGYSVEPLRNTSLSYIRSQKKSTSGKTHTEHQVQARGRIEGTDITWQVAQGIGHTSRENSTSVMFGYDGPKLACDVTLVHTREYNTIQVGSSGSLVLYQGRLTPAQYIYGPAALVQVPDVADVVVESGTKVTTDSTGRAVLTNLRRYAQNAITVDPATLPEGALLLEDTTQYIYPTNNALVPVTFPVRLGRQAFLTLKDEAGNPIAFGTFVSLVTPDGKADPYVQGIVGEGGRLLLGALPVTGKLTVQTVVNGQKKDLYYRYALSATPPAEQDGFRPIEHLTLTPEATRSEPTQSEAKARSAVAVSEDGDRVYLTHIENVTIAYLTDRNGIAAPAGSRVRFFDDTGTCVSEAVTEQKGRIWVKGPVLLSGTITATRAENGEEKSVRYTIDRQENQQ